MIGVELDRRGPGERGDEGSGGDGDVRRGGTAVCWETSWSVGVEGDEVRVVNGVADGVATGVGEGRVPGRVIGVEVTEYD